MAFQPVSSIVKYVISRWQACKSSPFLLFRFFLSFFRPMQLALPPISPGRNSQWSSTQPNKASKCQRDPAPPPPPSPPCRSPHSLLLYQRIRRRISDESNRRTSARSAIGQCALSSSSFKLSGLEFQKKRTRYCATRHVAARASRGEYPPMIYLHTAYGRTPNGQTFGCPAMFIAL